MNEARLCIGDFDIPLTSAKVDLRIKHDPLYFRGKAVDRRFASATFAFSATAADLTAYDAFADLLTPDMPHSLDMTVTRTDGERQLLRVLSDLWPIDLGDGRTTVTLALVQGPRMQDGRWSPSERSSLVGGA